MSAHAPGRPRLQTPPLGRPFAIFTVMALVSGIAWTWVVTQVPAAGRTLVGVGGGVVVLLASIAVAFAVHYAVTVRSLQRQRHHLDTTTGMLQREMTWLAREMLPALGYQLRRGIAVPVALAEFGWPSHPAAQELIQALEQILDREGQARTTAAAACASMETELDRLAEEHLPVLVARVRAGKDAPEVALPEAMQSSQKAVRRLWEGIAHELQDSNLQAAAAMAACAEAAARVQAQVTSLLGRLRELEDDYGDRQDVFAHLLEMDHRISQMGRLADNIALLSGGRSGRRWTKAIGMESVLRGAVGRIGAFQRVHLHSTSTAAVVGYAAEGVMHALAELIDNATKFSPHGTAVHVYVEEEDAGVVVTIEDSGLGMRTRERRLAESLVGRPLDLATLSGTRLGLAVVGRLADKYALTVSFRPSARGGIGVVVLIPRQLIMYLPVEDDVTDQQRHESHTDDSSAATRGTPPPEHHKDSPLPRRPRGRTLATTQSPPPPTSRVSRDARAAADRLASFRQRGTLPDAPAPSDTDDH